MNVKSLAKRTVLCAMSVALLVSATGCEVDSFMDPSVVGRWERTPVTMPILDRLDVIEGPAESDLGLTPVRPSDLVPDKTEYTIGVGDIVQVNIFELIVQGQDSIQQRRVDETGTIRLQLVGPVQAEGLTPSQLENEIAKTLSDKDLLRDATVGVIMLQTGQNTFSVLGEPRQGGTNVGTYAIPRPDFRLTEAIALVRGIPGRTKKVVIIRTVPLDPAVAGQARALMTPAESGSTGPEAVEDPTKLIDEMMNESLEGPAPSNGETGEAAPDAIASGLEQPGDSGQWVYVGGEWIPVKEAEGTEGAAATDPFAGLITQRLIEVPYQRLVDGDMRYNVVIRPGDIIRVPDPSAGFVYIGGQIGRPGAYNVPGEAELTLTQLVTSAGGLGPLAIPERTEIRRRVSENEEAILRFNLRAIFEGSEPNFFLKPNDEINVGTSFVATPLAIFRNGLRMTYGFGFILDRNFGVDVFPQ